MVSSATRVPSELNKRRRELHALPLGRPPLFKTPVTISPFTAEKKLLDAIQALQRRLGLPKAEICRRAMKIGLKVMIADLRQTERDEEE